MITAAGDTYRATAEYLHEDDHLYFVISDPQLNQDVVAVVALSSWSPHKDQSCILEPDDHPFVRQRSCIYYPDARCLEMENLRRAFRGGILELHNPASPLLLEQIQEGAAASPDLPNDVRDLLCQQGLI